MTAVVVSLTLVATLGACEGRGDDGGKKASAANVGDKRLGVLRFDDKMTRVAPMVIHEPRMDLRTYCLNLRDTAKKQGKEMPLCFEEKKRARNELKTIRVETAPKAKIGQMMKMLMAQNEGAHFVVDETQTIYQVLDLTHAARRGTAYPRGEVRVISVGDAEPTVKLITENFGSSLKITRHKLKPTSIPAAPKAPPKPDKHGAEPGHH